MQKVKIESQILKGRIKELDLEIEQLEKKLTAIIWERKKYQQFYNNSAKK